MGAKSIPAWREDVTGYLARLNTQTERVIGDLELSRVTALTTAKELRQHTEEVAAELKAISIQSEARLQQQMRDHEIEDTKRFLAATTEIKNVSGKVNIGIGILIALNVLGGVIVAFFEFFIRPHQ